MMAALLGATAAGAAETQAQQGTRRVQPLVLACPAGSVQVGGHYTAREATLCVKAGTRKSHGPYAQQWSNGNLRAKGQYLDGKRSGLWVFFDEAGNKEAEVSFTAGNFDGRRVEFHPNGRIKLEETWVKGKRQGLARRFDRMGDVVEVKEFRDNRVVATR